MIQTIFIGIKVVMRHQPLTISHFILAIFSRSCNIHRVIRQYQNIRRGGKLIFQDLIPSFQGINPRRGKNGKHQEISGTP
jgi:hypothetical protein